MAATVSLQMTMAVTLDDMTVTVTVTLDDMTVTVTVTFHDMTVTVTVTFHDMTVTVSLSSPLRQIRNHPRLASNIRNFFTSIGRMPIMMGAIVGPADDLGLGAVSFLGMACPGVAGRLVRLYSVLVHFWRLEI